MLIVLDIRKLIALIFALYLPTAFATSLKTSIAYNNDSAVLTLPAITAINEIKLTSCSYLDSTQTGSKTCVKSQFSQNLDFTIDSSNDKKVSISNPGVSLLQVFGERRAWQSAVFPNPLEYEQLVFIRESPTSEISSLASKYNPLLSFHEEEKYFPITLSSIFDLPISSFGETNIEFNESSSTSAGEILSKYASPSNYAFLDKASAKSLTGAKDSFPAYFLHETNGEKLWISYIYFFGFDEKTENSPANHQLDRESIIVQFSRVNNQWSPDGVVYAGHLPEQPTEFLGSEKTGTALTRWDGGKSFVQWKNVSKGPNGNPLIYVARGSHAMFPALGWFNVINVGVIPNLKEPAGSNHDGFSGSLSFLDMSKNKGLTFSGSIVDGLGSGAKNSRFPPFIRMPLQNFTASAGTNFNDCVANKQGCEKYINQAIAPAITDLAFTPATANTAAKLTAVFSTNMQSSYSTTGAYVPKVGKEGYWPDPRTFVVEFSSVTPGGQITLVASGFKSVSGQPLAADRVYTFPQGNVQNFKCGTSDFICDDFDGSLSSGTAFGIDYASTPRNKGLLFGKNTESRVEYPFSLGFPLSGTVEMLIKVDSAYAYDNSTLASRNCAPLFLTDWADVTWPGSTWFWGCSDGTVILDMATTKYDGPRQRTEVTGTSFGFGKWVRIGFSYGSGGQSISIDGKILDSNIANTQTLGSGGDHSSPSGVVSIGEFRSKFFSNNQYEGGYEGIIDWLRVSSKKDDWMQ